MLRRPRNRKAQIVVTAAELFCSRGYHNVGVDDIADEVGITGPAIYRHFRNKQAILAHAVSELCDSFTLATSHGDAAGSPAEALDAVVRGLARQGVERRSLGRLYQWEGRHLSEPDRLRVTEQMQQGARRLRDLLIQVRPELSRSDAGYLTAAALSVLVSPSTHRAKLARGKAELVVHAIAIEVLELRGLPHVGGAGAPRERSAGPMMPRRERLLAEAVRLFHLHGYHGVSVEDIGAAAGINASSVYRHFASKTDLLTAVFYRAAERLSVATADALGAAGDAETALRALVTAYVRLILEQSDMAAVYVSENTNLPAADRHRLRDTQRRHVDTWVRLAGECRTVDSSALVRFRVHAALNVVTDIARGRRGHPDVARATHLVLEILFGGIR
ncbi:transcriptional regulator, TetR family [Amycolatopsis marina]|uniref:Transcriptional regulator, TetR family n=1 Tax=Amycolatopsis marina TaxID=490629 RepID=A0A1I1C838_9PSEU|nr:transcriptional regulator, TetR family [Amycolatopsis marina]